MPLILEHLRQGSHRTTLDGGMNIGESTSTLCDKHWSTAGVIHDRTWKRHPLQGRESVTSQCPLYSGQAENIAPRRPVKIIAPLALSLSPLEKAATWATALKLSQAGNQLTPGGLLTPFGRGQRPNLGATW